MTKYYRYFRQDTGLKQNILESENSALIWLAFLYYYNRYAGRPNHMCVYSPCRTAQIYAKK